MDDGSLLIITALVILIILYLFLPFTEQMQQNQGKRREVLHRLYDELPRIEENIIRIKDNTSQQEKKIYNEKILHYYQGLYEYILSSINSQKQISALAIDDEVVSMPQLKFNMSDDFLEEIIASYKRKKEERAGGFCVKCGSPIRNGDRFCWSCGVIIE